MIFLIDFYFWLYYINLVTIWDAYFYMPFISFFVLVVPVHWFLLIVPLFMLEVPFLGLTYLLPVDVSPFLIFTTFTGPHVYASASLSIISSSGD